MLDQVYILSSEDITVYQQTLFCCCQNRWIPDLFPPHYPHHSPPPIFPNIIYIYILYRYLLLYIFRFTQSFNYFSTILLCFSSLRLFIVFFFSLPSLPSFLSSFILISYFSLSLVVYLYDSLSGTSFSFLLNFTFRYFPSNTALFSDYIIFLFTVCSCCFHDNNNNYSLYKHIRKVGIHTFS